MILYTTMPQELIFPTDESSYGTQQIIEFEGIPLLVEKIEQSYHVIRVMSSNPNDYLDQRCFPGTKISLFQ